MKYFFVISYAGLDKNGNSRHKVRGFKMGSNPDEYIIMNKVTMVEAVGGRWSDKTEAITTTKNIQQIREKLNNSKLQPYSFALCRE